MDRTNTWVWVGRSVLLAPISQAMEFLVERRRRHEMRKTLRQTSELLLRDIGLTADDVMAALEKPLTEDASDAMAKTAAARAGNW